MDTMAKLQKKKEVESGISGSSLELDTFNAVIGNARFSAVPDDLVWGRSTGQR